MSITDFELDMQYIMAVDLVDIARRNTDTDML